MKRSCIREGSVHYPSQIGGVLSEIRWYGFEEVGGKFVGEIELSKQSSQSSIHQCGQLVFDIFLLPHKIFQSPKKKKEKIEKSKTQSPNVGKSIQKRKISNSGSNFSVSNNLDLVFDSFCSIKILRVEKTASKRIEKRREFVPCPLFSWN